MCINANKYDGIFSVACESVYTARLCRVINNANVLAMGGNIIGRGWRAICATLSWTPNLPGYAGRARGVFKEVARRLPRVSWQIVFCL
jgi:hypothetical protein